MGKVEKPSWINPTDLWVNQGEKFAPVFTLPDNRVFAPWQKRRDVTPQSIIGRGGVTGIGNYDAPSSIRHFFNHGVDLKNIIGAIEPGTWTRSQVISACRSIPLNAVEGNDFGEGTYSFNPDSNVALWWYHERRKMAIEAGITRRLDYGHHGCTIAYQGDSDGKWRNSSGSDTSPTDAFFRNAFRSKADARANIGYFNLSVDGIAYEDMVGCNVKNYAGIPDWARTYYVKNYAIRRMGNGMGKVDGMGPGFLLYNDWPKIEGIGNANTNAVGNGFRYQRRIETTGSKGLVESEEHPQVDYDWQVGCYLINGFMYSDGVSTFDVPTRFGIDPSKMAALNTPGPGNDNVIGVYWTPDVAGTPAPVTADGYPIEPNRWHDAGYEAAGYYNTFKQTEGVGWKPLTYRFAGSENFIFPPADGASILEHAAAFDGPNSVAQGARRGRPTVDGRVKNKAWDFVAFDASRGKMYTEEIRVLAPNGIDQVPVFVQGCVPQVYNQILA